MQADQEDCIPGTTAKAAISSTAMIQQIAADFVDLRLPFRPILV
jgi:hypothetical protein